MPSGPSASAFVRGRRGRYHGHATVEIGQQPQDVALDAKIVSNNVIGRDATTQDALLTIERRTVTPLVLFVRRNELGEIHAGNPRELTCVGHGLPDIGFPGHDAARLRTLLADNTRQLAGIDISNRDRARLLQEVRERALRAVIRRRHRTVTNDQAGGMHLRRLHVFAIGAGITDVRIRQGDNLAAVGGIREDFLVTGHCRIENNFADGLAVGTDGGALKYGAIL